MVQAGRCLSPDLSSGPDLGSGPAPRQAPPSVWSLLGMSLSLLSSDHPPDPARATSLSRGRKKDLSLQYNVFRHTQCYFCIFISYLKLIFYKRDSIFLNAMAN